ncbi:MAG: hypothetical protein HY974_02755 [Candidatus Kerfeldbacteria bacterium]|nr:hypothetical protein [Candidatus Kerfeldbacteria bacterium]
MEFVFDLSGLPTDSPWVFAWWLITHGGFVIFVLAGLALWFELWLWKRRHEYEHNVPYTLLAVDVPKTTEQSPLAVEQVFATLAATHSPGTLYERFWLGRVQERFSFEIVSLGGYIQFLIRTPVMYRDLIEASIYAQYPDAEITEVEDYIHRISTDFDTEAYDLWGTEFELIQNQVYPLRTYPEFKSEFGVEAQFKDPMASLLEVMGRIQTDEDIWLQLVITPTNDSWKHHAQHVVKAIVEGKQSKGGVIDYLLFKLPIKILDDIGEIILPLWGDIGEEKDKLEPGTVQKLTPGRRAIVEAIEHKASKIGFLVKFRLIYWGRRESFLKGRGASAVVGAVQQFTALDRNGFKPSKLLTTKAEYFLKQPRINRKQRRILRHFQARSQHRGLGHGFVLNTEELASLYHFPVVEVKAPLVKKTEVKKSEPPFALPMPGSYLRPVAAGPVRIAETSAKGQAPANLPFVED